MRNLFSFKTGFIALVLVLMVFSIPNQVNSQTNLEYVDFYVDFDNGDTLIDIDAIILDDTNMLPFTVDGTYEDVSLIDYDTLRIYTVQFLYLDYEGLLDFYEDTTINLEYKNTTLDVTLELMHDNEEGYATMSDGEFLLDMGNGNGNIQSATTFRSNTNHYILIDAQSTKIKYNLQLISKMVFRFFDITQGDDPNSIVGRNYATDQSVNVYPNPVSTNLNIDILNPNLISRYILHDISGKVVLEANNTTGSEVSNLDVSSLVSGTYLLRIGDVTKIIIKI